MAVQAGASPKAFRHYLPPERVHETGPASASGDFGSFGSEWGVPFGFAGGTDPDVYANAKAANRINGIPANPNPRFLPVIHPALGTGVEALVVAAWTGLAV
jgi:hippurate hydrolase